MNSDPTMSKPHATPVQDEGLRCLNCDYNLTGLPSGVCPECGQAFDVDELRRELAGGVPRPVPIWDDPQRFGRPEAFVRTVLCVWFRPDRFASTFPRTCAAAAPAVFSLTCHALAYAAGLGLAFLPNLNRLSREPYMLSFCLISIPAIAIAANLCELLIAAGPFALAGAGPHRRYQFLAVRRMVRFTAGHLMLSCAAAGSFLALEGNSHPSAGNVFWLVFGTSVVLWWLDLAIMLVTLGRRFGGVVIGTLLIPIIGAIGILLCYVGIAMVTLTLRS